MGAKDNGGRCRARDDGRLVVETRCASVDRRTTARACQRRARAGIDKLRTLLDLLTQVHRANEVKKGPTQRSAEAVSELAAVLVASSTAQTARR